MAAVVWLEVPWRPFLEVVVTDADDRYVEFHGFRLQRTAELTQLGYRIALTPEDAVAYRLLGLPEV